MPKTTITVRGVTFGSGPTKICVPLVAANREALSRALLALADVPWDLLEFRADFYQPATPRDWNEALQLIRDRVGEVPVLFTLRTAREGGEAKLSPEVYQQLLLDIAAQRTADLLDVELLTVGEQAADLTRELKSFGALVLGSSHDFLKTPSVEEMTGRLLAMQAAGMDMTKLAVMPQSRLDVLRLLEAAVRMEEGLADRPHVTMSMGTFGQLSRLTGAFTGSAFTFASAGVSSAPGQMDVQKVKQILTLMGPIAGE